VTPRRAARGFTLLEVMVAMAILALSLTAAFEVVGGAMQNHMRARKLELATLLARAKLAEVEAKFEEDGFRDFDQAEDGTFDDEGHPEIAWEVKTTKPTVDLGPDGVIKALTGAEGGVMGLLGLSPDGQATGGGPATDAAASLAASPMAQAAKASIDQQLTVLGEEIKKGVRQVRLTVSWRDGKAQESFTVATTMVVLTPGSQKAEAAAAAAAAPALAPIDSFLQAPGTRRPGRRESPGAIP
jgi:general secretion pathway protein I